jgi:K+-transporting ATPase ATPase C chain
MMRELKPALLMLLVLSLLTGVLYPGVVTGIAQLVFPAKANGSLIERDGKIVGSELIGQAFSDAKYFWSRPSATSPMPYNSGASSGANLAPTNPKLIDTVKERVFALQSGDAESRVPVDLVTHSASGLDPHISPAAARYQVPRVAKARGVSEAELNALVNDAIEPRQIGILGEPAVNVLKLNLELDALTKR